ncbi:MAG: alpha/beta hydrolase, partial [Patescibacteria group bacterium]
AGITLLERSGSIYSIGGFAQTQKVYRFETNSDGTLTTPVAQPGLIMSYDRGAAVRIGNQIFAFAGTTLAQADIDLGGNVGIWTNTVITVPMGNWCCGTMNASDNFVYIMGGFNAPNSYLSSVVFAPILAVPEPTATPTVTPTPTTLPTPTPTSSPDPIVFIPGMGASWNYEAIMHNQNLDNSEWNLNPFVNVYDSLLDALQNQELYVFNYDWRKKIQDNVSDLLVFLDEKGANKYDLIGHSMGGLIARHAAISNPDLVDKIVIAGSPHLGSANTYKLWEGAEFSVLSLPERIALELYINTHRKLFDTSISTVQNLIPSLKDVFPTYDFLKNSQGALKPLGSMTHKNDYLPEVDEDEDIADRTMTIYGSGLDTLWGYSYVNRNSLDTLLGKWVDGKPTSDIFEDGDDTVIVDSAKQFSGDYSESSEPHSRLLRGQGEIEAILSHLAINETATGDSESEPDSALVISIASPATFVVTGPDNTVHNPSDNLLVIFDPVDGEYTVTLTSTALGEYKLMVGKLTEDDSAWQSYSGTFTKVGKTQEYKTTFEESSSDLGTNPLTEAKLRLDQMYQKVLKSSLTSVKKAILIADIKVIKVMVVTLEKNRNKPKYIETARVLLSTIQASIRAFPSFAPDLRIVQDLVEEELENNL